MKHETRTILETPFTAEQIKQRKGQWGKTLDYIEGYAIVQRLNDAFESDWSFHVTQFEILDDEVIVTGKLSVGDLVKMQFGSNRITKDSESGKVLSLGDDLKAAATDSLKKCASLLGVGLHLYGDHSTPKTEPAAKKTSEPTPKPNDEKPSSGKPKPGNGNGSTSIENLITPKQKKYVLTLGRRTNLTDSQVQKLCIDNYSIPLDELTKHQASDLIAMLTA